MELFCSNGTKSLTFKETGTLKVFIIFQEMKLSNFNIGKFLIFSQKKAFVVFRETETPKKFFMFQETEVLIFKETQTLKIFLHFRKQLSMLVKISGKSHFLS